MKLIRGLHNVAINDKKVVLTIGNFDGVHLGHRHLLQRLKECAGHHDCRSMAMVFEPQPKEYFDKVGAPLRLTRLRDKHELLAETGIDYLLVVHFGKSFCSLSAQAFLQNVLIEQLDVRHLLVGDDFRFGNDRKGDFEYLCVNAPFGVTDSKTVMAQDSRISSTRVREVLAEGNMVQANALLGWEYHIQGRVVHGRKLGRTLGFPTANVGLGRRQKVPLEGVFAVEVELEGTQQRVNGVANIGQKPTIDFTKPSLEVHLLNYSGDLYGQRLKVFFKSRIRGVQRFESLDQLKAQIAVDIATAKQEFNLK